MGYVTRFEGGVSGPLPLLDEFITYADEQDENDYPAMIEWHTGELFGGERVKWYDWKKDMQAVSKQFPYLLFTLSGEGEESGDIWKAWARNGKVVEVAARIVFDEPDLETDLPAPDVAKALAELKAKKIAEIDAEIAKLQAKKDSL